MSEPNKPVLDPLAKLKVLSKSSDNNDPFRHESEDAILSKLLDIFTRVPTGKELVDKSKEYGTTIKILKGQNDFSFSPDTNTVFIGLPAGQSSPKARMLIYLAMGLEEARQEYEGLPRPNVSDGKQRFTETHMQKQEDILFKMCIVSYEMIKSLGLREIIDELTKMGHNDLYELYDTEVNEGHIETKI